MAYNDGSVSTDNFLGYSFMSAAEWLIHMNLPLSERMNVTSTLPRPYRALLNVSVGPNM